MSSYTAIERKLREVPEDCLDEISAFIDFTLYRRFAAEQKRTGGGDLSRYFGSLNRMGDGLTIQRQIRDEWN